MTKMMRKVDYLSWLLERIRLPISLKMLWKRSSQHVMLKITTVRLMILTYVIPTCMRPPRHYWFGLWYLSQAFMGNNTIRTEHNVTQRWRNYYCNNHRSGKCRTMQQDGIIDRDDCIKIGYSSFLFRQGFSQMWIFCWRRLYLFRPNGATRVERREACCSAFWGVPRRIISKSKIGIKHCIAMFMWRCVERQPSWYSISCVMYTTQPQSSRCHNRLENQMPHPQASWRTY